jgi:predicted lipid-binding transport protein (Tim44 family)
MPDDPSKYDEGFLDHAAERLEREPGAGGLAKEEEHLFHFQQIVKDEEKLDDLRQKEVDEIVTALHEKTPAEEAGVDIGVIKQLDPQFDEEQFRSIARETFYKVREARTFEDPNDSEALLSPQMQAEMTALIEGDVAAHRHHLMPMLTVVDAVIAGAAANNGLEEIDVDFSISSAEDEVDNATGAITSGDTTVRSWKERWHFQRDPKVDSSAVDRAHNINVTIEQWLVEHRGWIVTRIDRLPG